MSNPPTANDIVIVTIAKDSNGNPVATVDPTLNQSTNKSFWQDAENFWNKAISWLRTNGSGTKGIDLLTGHLALSYDTQFDQAVTQAQASDPQITAEAARQIAFAAGASKFLTGELFDNIYDTDPDDSALDAIGKSVVSLGTDSLSDAIAESIRNSLIDSYSEPNSNGTTEDVFTNSGSSGSLGQTVIIYGTPGNDNLYADNGNDVLIGGGGSDTFHLGTGPDDVIITTQFGSPTSSTVSSYKAGDNVYIDGLLYNMGIQDKSGAFWMNGMQATVGATGLLVQLTDGSTVSISGTITQDSNAIYVGGTNGIVLYKYNGQTNNTTVTLPPWVSPLILQYSAALLLSSASPLVLDLTGKGLNLTALNSAVANGATVHPVYFDMENDGMAIQTGWIGSGSGLLALLPAGSSAITTQSELFGNQSGVAGSDGFSSLAALDTNHDGKITNADAKFSQLRVWEDLNQDGISEPGELFTLAQLGITSISLNDSFTSQTIAGNQIRETSTFTINGKTQTIADVWFADDPVNSIYQGSYSLNPQALLLPQLRGYGKLPDLAIAMSQNSALMAAVEQFASLNVIANPGNVSSMVKQIMYLWAGVQNVDPNSRGGNANNFDARDIAFAEAFFDSPATNPPGAALFATRSTAIESIVGQIREQITARLLWQSGGKSFFSTLPTYNAVTDGFTGSYALNMTAINSAMKGQNLAYVAQQWINIFSMINGSFGIANITAANKTALTTAIAASDPSGALNYSLITQWVTNDVAVGNGLTMGTSGNDTFNLNTENNVVFGLGGNDTFNAFGGGVQNLYGGNGNDLFEVGALSAGSIVNGGAGANKIQTDSDISTISITNIQELDVNGYVNLTAAQLAGFAKVLNTWPSYQDVISAAGAGTYDLTKGNVLGAFDLQGSATGSDVLIGNALTQSITAGGGNDTIYAGSGNEYLFAGSGNDVLYGGAGNDTFQSHAAGIEKLYGGAGNDVFEVGNLAAGSLINGGGGTNVIQANGNISSVSVSSVQELDVNGEITLTAAQLAGFGKVVNTGFQYYPTSADYIYAAGAGTYDLTKEKVTGAFDLQGSTTGNDTLIGNTLTQSITAGGGSDSLDANGSKATLYGGAGNDTFVFGRGYGAETINEEYANNANTNILSLKSGVTREQLWFSKSGSDLLVQIIGTNDKMTIAGWYASATEQVDQIKMSDGHILTNTKVQNLVNAMAAMTMPATTTLTSAELSKIEPVIAANWT